MENLHVQKDQRRRNTNTRTVIRQSL